jgi:hypothetical protein
MDYVGDMVFFTYRVGKEDSRFSLLLLGTHKTFTVATVFLATMSTYQHLIWIFCSQLFRPSKVHRYRRFVCSARLECVTVLKPWSVAGGTTHGTDHTARHLPVRLPTTFKLVTPHLQVRSTDDEKQTNCIAPFPATIDRCLATYTPPGHEMDCTYKTNRYRLPVLRDTGFPGTNIHRWRLFHVPRNRRFLPYQPAFQSERTGEALRFSQ